MRVPNAVARQALPRPIGRQAVLLIHTFFETAVQQTANKLEKKVRRKNALSWTGILYIYMIADELARARDACDALCSDDPLRPEMRSLLDTIGKRLEGNMPCGP